MIMFLISMLPSGIPFYYIIIFFYYIWNFNGRGNIFLGYASSRINSTIDYCTNKEKNLRYFISNPSSNNNIPKFFNKLTTGKFSCMQAGTPYYHSAIKIDKSVYTYTSKPLMTNCVESSQLLKSRLDLQQREQWLNKNKPCDNCKFNEKISDLKQNVIINNINYNKSIIQNLHLSTAKNQFDECDEDFSTTEL